jgi:hypothetical protein
MKKILLVEPNFPIPPKSKNHKNFLPIGLLKIASYLRSSGIEVRLIRGSPDTVEKIIEITRLEPDEIWVTSLFTYWAKYVKDAVQNYKSIFPKVKIVVGGIYASLLPEHQVKEYTGCDAVWQGVVPEAEKYFPAYDLVANANPNTVDYQIIHASRGCRRECPFCGTWKIEPAFTPRRSVREQIKYRKVVFYDNNLLMNPYIENILHELVDLRRERKIFWCECQSGFDGRVLLRKPHLAQMIRDAGFRYPRIAWDWRYEEYPSIREQINLLTGAGYPTKDIYVFMLYNWDIPFEEMETKRRTCWEWQVQIADCRYRPLNQLYDNYDPRKTGQTAEDYYIHEHGGWTDLLVKQFRKNIREQNICIRHGFPFYSRSFEHKKFGREIMRKVKEQTYVGAKTRFLKSIGADFWLPSEIRYPSYNRNVLT